MVKTNHEDLALKVQNEIKRHKSGNLSLEKLSSNYELAVLINVKSKSYISQILARYIPKEDRQYREKLLIARNASNVAKDTVKYQKGIHKLSERSSYASAGGTASYKNGKGIHSLTSDEKSFYGQVGKLVSVLGKRLKQSQ